MNSVNLMEKILPAPKKLTFNDSVFTLGKNKNIYSNFDSKGSFGYLLKLCKSEKEVIKKSGDSNVIKYLTIGKEPVQATIRPEFESEEAYAMQITQESVTIVAHTENGLSYGLKTLAKLACESDEIPGMTIQDEPSTPFRGMHLCIFNPDDGTEKEDTSPASIRKMLLTAAMSGYNYVFLEFWGMFPYRKRAYAVWPNDIYTTDIVKGIIGYAIDDLHITLCPCQNLTSHAGWSRIISRKHVVLDQRPDLADMWVPGGWCFATENPDTKAYLKDIMDELMDAYRTPPLFHVSCDKCFGFGSTEEDRTKPADVLFMSHLCFLNSYLAEHGSRMVLWADMLYSSMDSLFWKANPGIVDYLPKNVLINLWTHNDPGAYWYDVEFFEKKGFQTIYSPFIEEKGIRSMVRICNKNRSHGILQTTWHRPKTAVPSVILSGALQWNEAIYTPENISSFSGKWYREI